MGREGTRWDGMGWAEMRWDGKEYDGLDGLFVNRICECSALREVLEEGPDLGCIMI